METFDKYDQLRPDVKMVKSLVSRALGVKKSFKLAAPEYFKREDVNIDEWAETFLSILGEKKPPLFEGVGQLLKALYEIGITIIIVSHNKEKIIRNTLREHGLEGYVSLVMGGDHHSGLSKPNPALFTKHIHPFTGAPKDKTIMVGDTAPDLLFANNIGIDACCASYGCGDADSCQSMDPKYTVGNVEQLETVLINNV